MTERLLSVDAEPLPGNTYRRLRLPGHAMALPDSASDRVAAELDRLYAAAEANQAPGPDWKAKLREQVERHHDPSHSGGWIGAIATVLQYIDALPDPPTPAPDVEAPSDLLYRAWGLLANACGGDWDEADRLSPGWKAAAIGWREAWHATLPGSADPGPTAPTPDPDAPPVYVPPGGHYAPVLGRDVPDGWVGRRWPVSASWRDALSCRTKYPNAFFEVRRVPAPEPATEWVPLHQLRRGMTVPGASAPVHDWGTALGMPGEFEWWPEGGERLSAPLHVRDDGRVEVLAEGER